MTPNDLPIREPDQIRQDCVRKIRGVQVSEHFQAILGCLLGEDWTTPRLVEMVITPDGHLLGRCEARRVVQSVPGRIPEDLVRNIHGVAPVAELDGDEVGYLWRRWLRSRGNGRNRTMWIFTKHGFFSAVCRPAR